MKLRPQPRFETAGTIPATVGVYDVSKRFQGPPVVNSVSLDVYPGQFTMISGYSGSGKSTLLSMMAGIVKPDYGSISVFGQDIMGLSEKKLDNLLRGRINVGFQRALSDSSFTVAENVQNQADALGRPCSNEWLLQLADMFQMRQNLFREVGGLSGGEQSRVGIMTTLAPNPEVYFLDEPESALNTQGKEEVYGVLKSLAQLGKTVVMITQTPELARPHINREVVMQEGAVIADLHFPKV